MTAPSASTFQIAEHCNREQFDQLIGPFPGIIVSDRWPGYEHLQPDRRQVCWSHLLRDFRRHSEGLAEQKTFGEAELELTSRVFGAWRDFQEHQDRRRLRRELKPTQRELRRLIERAGRNSKRTRFHRVFANNLLKVWPALWTFATHPDVEPTNNPPNAHSAAQSSTENSRTAPAPKTVNDSPNEPSRPQRPAANNTDRYSTS
jgi:transposase